LQMISEYQQYRVFGIIPNLMSIAFIAAAIWMLVAMVIAVRQALDYKSTWRAVGVVVTAFLIQSIILFMILKPIQLRCAVLPKEKSLTHLT